MSIKNTITETYPEETFLFADGFDDAIIGIDSKFIVCYDQDKCIEILEKDCGSKEDASEYFWYNVEGAYMGEKTPRFIKRFQIIKPDIDLNVSAEHSMRPDIFESPDRGQTVYKRKAGDYSNRQKIESDIEFGEGEGHD